MRHKMRQPEHAEKYKRRSATAEPLAVPETPAAPEAPVTDVPEAPVADVPQAPVAEEPAEVAQLPAEVAHLPAPAEVPHMPAQTADLPTQTEHLPDEGTLHLPGAAPVLAAEAPLAPTTTPSPPPAQAPASPFFAALP